eukprot:c11156_g1_i1.p1 GENE.c11156_g1_i1~~c11156_g1_i1.p1  ORF type:complete len:263 (-),score=54.80 c11156_g1_i1:102-890(-)
MSQDEASMSIKALVSSRIIALANSIKNLVAVLGDVASNRIRVDTTASFLASAESGIDFKSMRSQNAQMLVQEAFQQVLQCDAELKRVMAILEAHEARQKVVEETKARVDQMVSLLRSTLSGLTEIESLLEQRLTQMGPKVARIRDSQKHRVDAETLVHYSVFIQKTTSGNPNPTNDELITRRGCFHQTPFPQESELRISKLFEEVQLPEGVSLPVEPISEVKRKLEIPLPEVVKPNVVESSVMMNLLPDEDEEDDDDNNEWE